MKTGKLLVITPLLGIIMGLVACGNGPEAGFYGSGTLEATEILIGSQVNGMVLAMNVEEGNDVVAGQVIAIIDSERVVLNKQRILAGITELDLNMNNLRRTVALARDNLNNTQKKFDRIESLYNDGSTTQQNYDDIETALSAAKIQYENTQTSLRAATAKKDQLAAQLGLLERELRDCQITSPANGTVLEKLVDAGELVRTGSSIATIADISTMTIKVYVSETELRQIKTGQSVRLVTGTDAEQSFTGTIAWISPRAEFTPKNVQTREARADLVYAVKVRVENPDGVLKIGMPGEIYL